MGGDRPPVRGDRGGPTDFDAIVIGAGITGLVSASILLEQGSQRVLVVDEYDHVGGNHIDRTFGDYTFDVGSLIFQDDSPLLRHFPEILPQYVPIDPSWGKLNPQGIVTDYPFSMQDDFISAGPIECFRMVLSASYARLRRRRMRNARDFAQYWIGGRLLWRSGLENYMERFCGLPADKIDLRFAEKRMLWISEHASMANMIRQVRSPGGPKVVGPRTNQQLARSREGFTHLYQPAVERLERNGVTFALGADLRSLERMGQTFGLELPGGHCTANRIVSTIPIDRMLKLCGIPRPQALPTVTLISLFFSFAGRRGFPQPILYNFSHQGQWKRLTVYSDFYGSVRGREFMTVEVIATEEYESIDAAAQNFRQHSADNGLFSGDLRLEGSYTLSQAYPIYTEGAGERAEESIAALRAFGVESFGRQGGFQYQPTSRVSTQEAESAMRQS